MSFRIKDTVWVQQSFLLPESALNDVDQRRRVLTSAAYKFTDTTLGGNFAINAPPQFTRYADIRVGGSQRYSRGATNGSTTPGGIKWMMSTGRFMTEGDNPNSEFTTPSAGMGRYYSEAIDDWGQDLVMRFGVPEYNSLIQFFGNFYSTDAALLSRTGRTSNVFATAGKALGFLLALPLQPVILGGQIIKFLGAWPASKYYYMKPTMYPYWQAVNTIANAIAVNIGVIPMALTEAQTKVTGQDSSYLGDQNEMLQEYAKVLPDIFLRSGQQAAGLDVYAIANRAQRIANTFNAELQNKVDSLTDASGLFQAVNELKDKLYKGGGLKRIESQGIDEYRNLYLNSDRNRSDGQSNYIKLDGTAAATDTADAGGTGEAAPAPAAGDGSTENVGGTPTTGEEPAKQIDVESVGPDGNRDWYNMGDGQGEGGQSWLGSLKSMFEAERRDGAQYVTFRVGYSGSSNESFSSSVEESQIQQKFNSTSSSSRSARFDWANGNLGVPGLDQVMGAVKDFVSGTLEGLQMSGLMALAGNAFVDIPKTWSGSTANLPKAEYTIKLRSPYGTRMSRLMNLYIPLSMLLAAALPLSTGKHSYTSPFICEAFCRGRHAIRLGMITDMSITRGTGNLGWTQDGDALGIDVTFSITDLSSIMHLPIQTNFGYTDMFAQAVGDLIGGLRGQEFASYAQKGTYDDDNTFTDYMAVLGSLSWQDMVYSNRRWKLARYRQMQNWTSWKSPGRVAMWAGNTTLGRIINAISTETDRTD
ncbi:hypothetical protein [Xanthomonas phage RTH11]|nr:hypothetical protein [Xanthomonas phage RTH11]